MYSFNLFLMLILKNMHTLSAQPSVHWHCWLDVRKIIRHVKHWVMRCWRGTYLSGARCNWFAYDPTDADATVTLSFLASFKSRLV